MINANKEALRSFFSGTLQYVVPFFQRSYVWDEENWEILWDHIERTSTAIAEGQPREHFIGTLITKQRESQALGENKLDLIDGQQRLTTFAILFRAIADSATGKEPYTLLASLTQDLLAFKDARAETHNRIEHSKNDKPYFDAVLNGDDLSALPNQDHRILRCYHYFRNVLKDFSDAELDRLKTIILTNIPLISMLLSPNDDEQEIFDTINSLGVRLTTGELLKNYIFSDLQVRDYYSTHWEPIFEDDEEQLSFWNKTKTAGRVSRTNIEVLLYCYLIIQKKSPVELERLFKEYKIWLKDKSLGEKIVVLEEIKALAEIYFTFPDSSQLNEIKFSQGIERFFHVIDSMEITTVYPLVLFIFNRVNDANEQLEMLGILESYIVRRQVCRLTNKNYNKVFVQMIKNLDAANEVSATTLAELLAQYTDDGNRKPIDEEFVAAFADQPISHVNAREVLFCIALYQVRNPKHDVQQLSSSSYTTEHMMPQKWEEHWSVEGMNDVAKLARNKQIKTLGNLTLVTQPLNSSMRNGPWNQKRTALRNYSSLKITTDYVDKEDWNESEIESRARNLASAALDIWP